jgi:CRISPR-associated protein Cas7/Cse4/CasC subtype I-E
MAGELVEEGFAADKVDEVLGQLIHRIFEEDGGERKRNGESARFEHFRFEQAYLLGAAEIEYLKGLARSALEGDEGLKAALATKRKNKTAAYTELQKTIIKNLRDNLDALRASSKVPQSVEAALFGRMITSDLIANTDAAIHVAHAFTVHKEATESDYFTVVDDLTRDAGETGAGGLFDTELTAGLFYGYIVVDVPLLVSNLGADPALAGKVVEHLVHLIATVSPGAKKGSTAPYAWAELMLVEAGRRQPRTLANAFRTPVPARTDIAVGALAGYLGKVDRAYGNGEARRHTAIEDGASIPESQSISLAALAAWARDIDGVRRRYDRRHRPDAHVPVRLDDHRAARQRARLDARPAGRASALAGAARDGRAARSRRHGVARLSDGKALEKG